MAQKTVQKSKTKLLDAGLEAVRRRGFAAVSIKDIVDAAGVPKGSFHYYFANKEAYALALLDHFGRHMADVAATISGDRTLGPVERLRRFFDAYAARMDGEGHATGCLLGVMAAEAGDAGPALRSRVEAGLTAFASFLTPHVKAAQEAGALNPDLDAAEMAAFLVDAWEGALLRMKATGGAQPLEAFQRVAFGALFAGRNS